MSTLDQKLHPRCIKSDPCITFFQVFYFEIIVDLHAIARPCSPLNPTGPTPAGLSQTVLHTSRGHLLWGSSLGPSSVALCPAGRGQPSPICSQHLSQFCNLCLPICCLHQWKILERGQWCVHLCSDTQFKAWPHRVPGEPLLD